MKSAQIKPETVLQIDEGVPKYIYKNDKVACSGSAGHTLGCTRVEFYANITGSEFTPEGALKKMTLQIGLRNIEIELLADLKKGSCLFDVVLKHELTHLALHRRILNRFAPEIAKAVLVEAEKQLPPMTQAQFNRISRSLVRFLDRMAAEDDRQNALMDSTDAYLYQQRQCEE
ncbi:MAG: hypothetical protein IJ752_05755 [Alphaproteobacteria bacterium]|nr:hypothetical protein [Alphaproteobacteria bacterium]